VERLRSGVRRRLGGKVAGATGLDALGRLESEVDSLEVAVAENTALQVPLEGIVDALEQDVAEVLEWRAERRAAQRAAKRMKA
jgi:hypothetical protein